ncbi:MAG: TlyA family RNA methyltransferase [Defluviitaleaceae bacterium]|nr:TlyA family RNA methyltransferase [Defluviitaleaceae bacterium]
MEKMERLDILLANTKNISRERAKDLIKQGNVKINDMVTKKPSTLCQQDCKIELILPEQSYVSRGGYKLAGALAYFCANVKDAICIDIGASTGGFTDCLLQHGAARVYAVDVGTKQLHPLLVSHPQVISMEQVNIKNLQLDIKANFITIDVSFISLKTVLPIAYNFLYADSYCLALIKPQFEVGFEYLSKKGTPKDLMLHKKVIRDITEITKSIGFQMIGHTPSELQGKKSKNTEYFCYLKK